MVPPFTFIDRTEPVSPIRPTTTSGPSLRPSVRHSASELRELGVTTYRKVWDEFYQWEPGYASGILADIKNNPVVRARGARNLAKSMVARFSERMPFPVVVSGDSATSKVVVTEYDSPGTTPVASASVSVPTVVLADADRLPPHPPYECCPPIHRSFLLNEFNVTTVKFLPYADDPTFPVKSYLEDFKHLEWAQEFDPDCKHQNLLPLNIS